MKYSKYFGAKRRGFIKTESNLAPKGASHFKNENIRCDIIFMNVRKKLHCLPLPGLSSLVEY